MGRFIIGAPTDHGMNFVPIEADQIDLLIEQECDASQYPWMAAKLRDSLAAAADGCAIQVGDDVVGYWLVQCVLDEAELLNLVIFKPFQAKGLGQKVLVTLCAQLKKQGIKQFFLEVRESNVWAQALYQKAGFSVIAYRPNYYPVDDARDRCTEDALILRCGL